MEIGLGQYTSQGGITAWKICPIFQGKKSSKPHSSSGGLIHVLSLSTNARHEMSRSCETHQFKEVTYKAVPSGATSRLVDPENFRRSSSLSFPFQSSLFLRNLSLPSFSMVYFMLFCFIKLLSCRSSASSWKQVWISQKWLKYRSVDLLMWFCYKRSYEARLGH